MFRHISETIPTKTVSPDASFWIHLSCLILAHLSDTFVRFLAQPTDELVHDRTSPTPASSLAAIAELLAQPNPLGFEGTTLATRCAGVDVSGSCRPDVSAQVCGRPMHCESLSFDTADTA
jgi:hypothetical protein